jgi:hypothetical protein
VPPLICGFIDTMRARKFRVESVCRVLTEHGVEVAPRTYRNWKTAAPQALNPVLPPDFPAPDPEATSVVRQRPSPEPPGRRKDKVTEFASR